MTSRTFQQMIFSGVKPQPLKNVVIGSAAIIRIQCGSKKLLWQDSYVSIDKTRLLLCHHRQQLTFENIPENNRFYARFLSLLISPLPEQLELSRSRPSPDPWLTLTPTLKLTLDFLQEVAGDDDYTTMTQTFYLQALYQQLAEEGVLHHMFPNQNRSLSEQLYDLFAAAPHSAHSLESVCEKLCLSRATLIRRLKSENTCFRKLLVDVRMGQALNLMQTGETDIMQLALSCGYSCPQRFSQRFRNQFGMTLKSYLASLPS